MEEYALKNTEFWREVCGSNAASAWGLDLSKPSDIQEFDNRYFTLYPYLLKDFKDFNLDKSDVIEVGLGAGTVSRYLAENASSFTGIDISDGPCEIVKRTVAKDSVAKVLQSSILEEKKELFQKADITFAIGSLHHTGNLELAIRNCIAMTKDGGVFYFMVYNHFAAYRWSANGRRLLSDLLTNRKNRTTYFEESNEALRAINDANKNGDAAPYTCYSSKKTLDRILSTIPRVKGYELEIRNTPSFKILGLWFLREWTMNPLGRMLLRAFGSDIYLRVKVDKHL